MAAAVLTVMSPLLAQSDDPWSNDDLPDLVTAAPDGVQPATVKFWDGEDIFIIRFNGHISNHGGGALHMEGNPQSDAPLSERLDQRVTPDDGTTWYDLAKYPNVIYEESDGHEHWHVQELMEYALWTEDQYNSWDTSMVPAIPASKVGFCLVESEPSPSFGGAAAPEVYDNDYSQWCGSGKDDYTGGPDITHLRMGISSGWRDTYDFITNLQWVEVSDAVPGVYYLSALTDPNDEVVEADETNNGIAFNSTPVVVPGYVAQPVAFDATGATNVPLTVEQFGTSLGGVAYTIETAPSHGTLMAGGLTLGPGDSFNGTLTYAPDAGYDGPDSFNYSAARRINPGDSAGLVAAKQFPHNPVVAAVDIDADGTVPNTPPALANPGSQASTVGDTITGPTLIATDDDGDAISYSAAGLPTGLSVDPDTGQISGTVTEADVFDVTATASDGSAVDEAAFTWTVSEPPNQAPTLADPGDQVTQIGTPVNLVLSASDPEDDDLTFSGTNLPNGLSVSPGGIVTGTPTAVMTRNAKLGVSDGDLDDEVTISWQITAAPPANQPPMVTPPGPQTTEIGGVVALQIGAHDPDGDSLTYGADGLPAGLTIDASTGVISGRPSVTGLWTVTVSASDGEFDPEVVFTWTVTGVPLDPSPNPAFDDVPAGHIFYDDIMWMVEAGITLGCGDGTFCPSDRLTRAQIASFFARALDLTDGAGEDLFDDDHGSVHEDNIDRLATAEITLGCGVRLFCPDDTVTRAQIASLIVRAYGLTDGAGSDLFTDDDGSVHEGNIDRLATAEITFGCEEGLFCPDQPVTRGQFAALLHRAAEWAAG